ncbi:Putative protein [Zobellia galactanivorans]|uniref:Uncharacterized protein n=1 Tax=Zobellia galactanivorans (strain DSM 12802 / CCUG 47099 / CIP 106680 / NCIMB 13871 / Dsij) TaxID=63186 RepID=G0LCM7_ZOBGA|nr:Putative protein [Zobellia galactanivorans]
MCVVGNTYNQGEFGRIGTISPNKNIILAQSIFGHGLVDGSIPIAVAGLSTGVKSTITDNYIFIGFYACSDPTVYMGGRFR